MTSPASPGQSAWADACLAAALVALSPLVSGGVVVSAQAGPVRDRWMRYLRSLCPADMPMRRLPLNAAPQRVLGGLDLTATLNAGHPVMQRGILCEADGGLVIAAMAERLEPVIAAQIAGTLETRQLVAEREGLQIRAITRFGVVALDESLEDEPGVPQTLTEQLAFKVQLDAISLRDSADELHDERTIAAARKRLPKVRLDDEVCTSLCAAALMLGVGSVRASILAGRVARLHAALHGRNVTTAEDAEAALRLVLVPRATRLPELEQDQPDEPTPQDPPQDNAGNDGDDRASQPLTADQLTDLLVQAARAILPPDLLAKLEAARLKAGRGGEAGRAGAKRKSLSRGRPIGTRTGELRPGSKLNIVETLRAAAPWQPLRRRQRDREGHAASAAMIEVRKEDFRLSRFDQPAESTAIFIVDASGSSAMNRLAEAKGAVELLLADCYVRRDQVALISFRDDRADLLLPPTRSLVRAKGALTGLAGGGGTPLANALDAGILLADAERRRGRTPVLVLLTDGQANVSRDGTRGRAAAREDAADAARRVRQSGVRTLLLDISPRPSRPAADLAAAMGGTHVPLPFADAQAVSTIVRAHVDAGAELASAG